MCVVLPPCAPRPSRREHLITHDTPDTAPEPSPELVETPPDFTPPPPTTGGRLGHVVMGMLAAATLAVWGVVWAGAWVSTLPWPMYLVATVSPWLSMALITATFAAWTLLPDHPAALWVSVATIAAPVAHWGPAWPDQGIDAPGTPLVVTSWNVRRLWGDPKDAQADALDCVVTTLQEQAPDVLVLQEVERANITQLTQSLGLQCHHAPYRASDSADASGLAICTMGSSWTIKQANTRAFTSSADWRYVFAEVEHAGQVVNVIGVHLHPHRVLHDPLSAMVSASSTVPRASNAQQAQTRSLLARAERLKDPSIIAGDFNSTRDTPLHAKMRRHLVDTYEVGAQGFAGTVQLADMIPLRIDYVYATPNLPIADARIPEARCSNHRPVVTVLHVPDKAYPR